MVWRSVVSLVLALSYASPATGSSARTVDSRYVGGMEGALAPCSLLDEGPEALEEIGGACFRIEPSDNYVEFQVVDDHATRPIGGWYIFRHTFGRPPVYEPFCGGATIPVEQPYPLEYVELEIGLALSYAFPACNYSPGIPTTGTITAVFS